MDNGPDMREEWSQSQGEGVANALQTLGDHPAPRAPALTQTWVGVINGEKNTPTAKLRNGAATAWLPPLRTLAPLIKIVLAATRTNRL